MLLFASHYDIMMNVYACVCVLVVSVPSYRHSVFVGWQNIPFMFTILILSD